MNVPSPEEEHGQIECMKALKKVQGRCIAEQREHSKLCCAQLPPPLETTASLDKDYRFSHAPL
jgi:hypothetical protein